MSLEAFCGFEYSDTFERLYSNTLSPVLVEEGFKPVRADRTPASESIIKKLIQQIKTCDLVVMEVTPDNANVYLELGIAISCRKPLILLSKRDKLPVDSQHLHHLQYASMSARALKKEFRNWVQKAREKILASSTSTDTSDLTSEESDNAVQHLDHWGQITSDFVDASIVKKRRMGDSLEAVRDAIAASNPVPTECIYGPEQGADRWIKLCQDTSYLLYQESVRFARDEAKNMLTLCGSDFSKCSPDFVSLGPGDGTKDLAFMQAIVDLSGKYQGFYYPYDISFVLLLKAIEKVAEAFERPSDLKGKAVLADFRSLRKFRPVFDRRKAPNLYSLLGNTLGNMSNESTFLRLLSGTMAPADRAIIEVRLLDQGQTQLAGGTELVRARHAFTPLELLGLKFDPSKFKFETKERRSSIGQTKTLVATYSDFLLDGNEATHADLYLIHHYVFEEISKALTEHFQILEHFKKDGKFAYFVLQKR